MKHTPPPVEQLFKSPPHHENLDELFHQLNQANILNCVYWDYFFSKTEYLKFDSIVECGVGRGRSLLTISVFNSYYSAKNKTLPRTVYAFDSFAGFPKPSLEDSSQRIPKRGEWAKSPSGKYNYSPAFIHEVLTLGGVTSSNMPTLIAGFFSRELFKSFSFGSVGILHLDADLYLSTKIPLESIAPFVCQGGIIVIDDFRVNGSPDTDAFPGCRKAVEEFMKENTDFTLEIHERGTPFLIKR